jgi:hypothetical protein
MKKSIFSLVVIAILAILSGCGGSAYNEYHSTQHKKEHKVSPKQVKKVVYNNFAHLRIKTKPKANRVYILNIKPKYKDGMKLKKGKYHIKVVKNGYQTYTKWIDLYKDTTLNITLKKRKDIYIPSKKDYFKYVTDIKWDSHNEYFYLRYDSKNKLIWALQKSYIDYVNNHKLNKPIISIERNYYGLKKFHTVSTIVESKIEWSDFKKNKDVDLLLFSKNSIYQEKNGFKIGSLLHLNINGQYNAWRRPSKKEIKRNNPFKKYQKYFELIDTRFKNDPENIAININLHDNSIKYNKANNGFYSGDIHKYHSSFELIIPVRKISSQYDKIIFSSLSPIQKLAKLTTLLTQEKLKVTKDKVKKPTKPKIIYPKKLKKGEFEKSADYKKRVEKGKQRVAKQNKQNELKYQQQMIDYKVAVKKVDENYKKQIELNKKESTIKKVANEVVGRAITMVFGDPKFKDFKYNADKEQFNATLYSTLNNFSMKVSIPVSISKAKEFKVKLTDSRLVPSVKFKVKNGKLVFDSVDVVANKIKQKQDFNIAKSKDSVDGYKEFLRYHSSAPQAKEAKKLLQNAIARDAYNDARYSISKLESFIKAYPHSSYTSKAKSKLTDLKERKRRKEERERKERESYYAKKHTGQQVCKKGRVAFGLIGVKISAYVENVRGDDIQLRISSTEGQSIHYQGGKLYSGKVIWDTYYNWGSCDY